MSASANWPALEPTGVVPFELEAEQGIWGKAHGAFSDFRWLAASPGLAAKGFGHELYLGSEDRPRVGTLWRALEDRRYLAVALRPSSAIDAAHRRGFLEKRLLVIQAPPALPVALLALAASIELESWPEIPAGTLGEWQDSDFRHQLAKIRRFFSREELEQRIELGRGLLSRQKRSALAVSFSSVRAGEPAFLESELAGAALAAFLLPLPSALAAKISVAGVVPSQRWSGDQLAATWQVVAGVPGVSRENASEWAQSAVRALEVGDPQLLRAEEMPADPAGAVANGVVANVDQPAWLSLAETFLTDDASWWLDLPRMPMLTLLEPPLAGKFAELVREFAERRAPAGAEAEWKVKADVAAALLLVTVPELAKDLVWSSGRVPPLLFLPKLPLGLQARWRRQVGELFEEFLRRSQETPIPRRHFDAAKWSGPQATG